MLPHILYNKATLTTHPGQYSWLGRYHVTNRLCDSWPSGNMPVWNSVSLL